MPCNLKEYSYKDHLIDCRPKLESLLKALGKQIQVVLVPYWGFPAESVNYHPPQIDTTTMSVNPSSLQCPFFLEFLNTSEISSDPNESPSVKLEFESTSFDHPVYIVFSSGMYVCLT